MIEIRDLDQFDLEEMVKLKIQCWTEELAGKAENTLSFQEELDFWTKWSSACDGNNDVRLLIGAFEGEELLGVAIGSFAEQTDIPESGIELNGLWVSQNHRNKGVSLFLLEYLLDDYKKINKEVMVIYNLHDSPSNSFYRKFGCVQSNQVNQMQGKLLVDIFKIKIDDFLKNVRCSLVKYK